MERIICDAYVKGIKRTWDIDPNNPKNQAFNQKIVAINDMYGWLYKQGILQAVSFELKDYSDATYFAFDANDLAPYRAAMEMSGVNNADLAVKHIFDEEYTPCIYSGAIDLSWTMVTYRDFDGTVSRSWECDLIKHLNSATVLDVEHIKDTKGVKEAVRAAFEFSGFEPEKLVVKPLCEDDYEAVERMDDLSGNYVSQWLEDNEDYAWGLFDDNKLVGYCSIGCADDVRGDIENYPGYSYDSLLLSDVFILPECRGKGYASFMVDKAIELRTTDDKELVFLTLLHDGLSRFYEKLGFTLFAPGAMVRDEREKGFEEVLDAATAKAEASINSGLECSFDKDLPF